MSGGFALSGLLLASLGRYALLTFLVTDRTREIGLRVAFGAQRRLVTSVVGGALRLVGIGAGLGIGLSIPPLRLFGALLYGVTAYDPSTYVTVVALLAPSPAWQPTCRPAARRPAGRPSARLNRPRPGVSSSSGTRAASRFVPLRPTVREQAKEVARRNFASSTRHSEMDGLELVRPITTAARPERSDEL